PGRAESSRSIGLMIRAPARIRVRRLSSALSHPGLSRKGSGIAVVALAMAVVSGGAVRLTGSGLGCSNWPACTVTSIVAPLQYHAWVEFGNRLINVVVTAAILLVVVATFQRRPARRDLQLLSIGLVAGVLGEVVLGGETVLHKLAPSFVMAHMLLAMLLVGTAVVLYERAGLPEHTWGGKRYRTRVTPATCLVRRGQLVASRAMLATTAAVVTLGAVVTSTGPHAGAPGVPRFGFSLHAVAQLHGTCVEVLIALVIGTLWWMHLSGVRGGAIRRAEALLVVLATQAVLGYSQYLTGDPVLLVGFHIAGATAVVIAMVAFHLGLHSHEPGPEVQTVGRREDPSPLKAYQ
ncbi:MAG TPA: COX15/CtaA family protein, partial [Acidimicrobiales bacterium]|nr:COX15/CtaA family protein [Acidimicrobiales bacterium]